MQTIWARAAQVRCTCNCISCSSASNAVARRTTTSTFRRGLQRADGFTVFSSTLAVSAALTDAAYKDQRSQEWARVIGEAKANIDAVEAEQQQRLKALCETDEPADTLPPDEPTDTLPQWGMRRCIENPERGERGDDWGKVLDWAAKENEQRALMGFEEWRGPSLDLLKSLTASEIEKLIGDDRIFRRFYGGPDCENLAPGPPAFPLTYKKLRTLEWSISKMTARLLQNTSSQTEGQRHLLKHVELRDMHLHIEQRRELYVLEATKRLKALREATKGAGIYRDFDSPSSPNYSIDYSREDLDDATEFNVALNRLLQNAEAGANLPSAIANICAKLLRSMTPPNVHTYNLLLVRFCRLERADLVHVILESMEESHIRPNEITHATLLRFCTVSDDHEAFRIYVRRMRGRAGGLSMDDSERSISYLARDRYHYFGLGNHKIAEKARMNTEVYCSLISGLLKMVKRTEAMYYFRLMISEGWKPSIELFSVLLRDCYEATDFPSGYRVWQQLQQDFGTATRLAYRTMLQLCRRCQQDTIFLQILHVGVDQGLLPSTILNLPDELIRGDVDILLEVADRKVDPKMLDDIPRRWRKHLSYSKHQKVLNIIRDSPDAEQRQSKLAALQLEMLQAKNLRKVSEAAEDSLNALEESLPELTSQATAKMPLPLSQGRSLQRSLGAKAMTLNKENEKTTPKVTQISYNNFKKSISEELSSRILPSPCEAWRSGLRSFWDTPAEHHQLPSSPSMPQPSATSLEDTPNLISIG